MQVFALTSRLGDWKWQFLILSAFTNIIINIWREINFVFVPLFWNGDEGGVNMQNCKQTIVSRSVATALSSIEWHDINLDDFGNI